MKILRVDDDVHEIIKGLAEKEDRKLTPYLNRHFRQIEGVGTPIEITLPPEKIKELNLPSIACPKCGMVSYNQNDIEQKYCGNCHAYHSDLVISKKSEATPQPVTSVADLIKQPAEQAIVVDMEQPCCGNELQPCKHWVWDTATGDGYINSLSGRKLEVE